MADSNRDCTSKCKSKQHAKYAIASIIRNVTDDSVAAFLCSLCCNFHNLVDELGRNVLHIAASCNNRSKLVEWLLKHYKIDLNVKDWESGWTALHRSLYYNQLSTACVLIKNGASLCSLDFDGLSPLDLAMKDLYYPSKAYLHFTTESVDPIQECRSDLYVFGSNANYNLGEESQQHRQVPTLMEYFTKSDVSLKQVVMQKYHSVFLSDKGAVYSCGHGQDGRLGLGTEQTRMLPCELKFDHAKTASHLKKTGIQQIAAGDNHTVLLTFSGEVWTCGLNNCHQLGHCPAPEKLLKPTKLNLKMLPTVVSVHAATFHTVLCTKSGVYSCGLNAGQLGHPKGERTQLTFREVSRLNKGNISITEISVSNGATVCVVDEKSVYVFHEYKFNKLPALSNIKKIEVIGGNLDYTCDPSILSKVGLPLQIMILNSEGNIYLFERSSFQLTRCIFSYPRQPFITDISLNCNGVVLLTDNGEGFLGEVMTPAKERQHKNKPVNTSKQNHEQSLQTFIDRNDCFHVRLTRLPQIHRALKAYSNLQGKSFSILQYQFKPTLSIITKLICDRTVERGDFLQLLSETFIGDGIHDIVIQINEESFPAHKYILASRSSYFRSIFSNEIGSCSDDSYSSLKIDKWSPELFKAMLSYIYGGFFQPPSNMGFKKENSSSRIICHCCDFNTDGMSAYQVKQLKRSNKCTTCSRTNVLSDAIEMSKILGLKKLTEKLTKEKIISTDGDSHEVFFNRNDLIHLSDVKIVSSDNVEFKCHKCILVTQSSYFRSMFASCWVESSSSHALNLQVTSEVLGLVLDYIYESHLKDIYSTSTISWLLSCNDVDAICSILVAADQFLLNELKWLCQTFLHNFVSLKNVVELVQFSSIYGAEALLNYGTDFICQNLPALLESRVLEDLDKELLDMISISYAKMVKSVSGRIITPFSIFPSSDEIEEIAQKFPVSLSLQPSVQKENEKMHPKASASVGRPRRRSQSQRHNSASYEEVVTVARPVSPPADKIVALKDGVGVKNSSNDSKYQEEIVRNRLDENEIGTTAIVSVTSETNSNFPGLGEAILKSPTSNTRPPEKNFSSKLSQKQRKKLASLKIKEQTTGSLAMSPDSESKAIVNPWQKIEAVKENESVSLKDIIKAQEGKVGKKTWNEVSRKPKNSPKSKTYGFSWVASGDKQASESVAICTPAWEKPLNVTENTTGEENLNISFSDILENEEKASAQLIKIQTKSLNIIQIEDRAIEELKEFYRAQDNPDEYIIIQRETKSTATPIWKREISA